MYLSTLLIDVGTNPDRPRPGRQWLRNLYRVHQRLCMAFPSDTRRSGDAHFLKPYRSEDFGDGHVHVKRKPDAGFLFRIDPRPGGSVVILVQSAIKPDWEYAFGLRAGLVDDAGRPVGNAGYLLSARPEVKSYDPSFEKGHSLRFRLMANPTRRLSPRSLGSDGKPVKAGVGKRVPVPTDRLLDWLDRRSKSAGFSLKQDATSIQPGYIFVNKEGKGQGKRLRSARYEGMLTVDDPARFKETLVQGVGPAKAFGFGLLSVAGCGS